MKKLWLTVAGVAFAGASMLATPPAQAFWWPWSGWGNRWYDGPWGDYPYYGYGAPWGYPYYGGVPYGLPYYGGVPYYGYPYAWGAPWGYTAPYYPYGMTQQSQPDSNKQRQ